MCWWGKLSCVAWRHCGWVLGQGAILLPDCSDGAPAGAGHGVVQVAYGFVVETVVFVSLMFLGDALLSMNTPLLQVRASPRGSHW